MRPGLEQVTRTTGNQFSFPSPTEARGEHFELRAAFETVQINVTGQQIDVGDALRGHEEADEPYAAFDVALAQLAKRLRRHKRRLHRHTRGLADRR